MANKFEQQSARRKFIYFGLILLLFTISLLHRNLVISAQGTEMLMRDVNRGKADLTDSALRLTLSGLRGVAVTSLWLAAIEKQKKHEWNELELAVDGLTALQPHFISPWLFQGWNLSFNVAVECDRPRDKYYYISRGIALYCRGEEKNDPGQAEPPQPWPASPDLRFHIADAYLRKIGLSDERRVMRCLFDMSCMPPAQRDPERFRKAGPRGKQIDLDKFLAFCHDHPRFVRRLREQLKGFDDPEAILQFMADNKDIPARLEDRSKLEAAQRLTEFPILPPQNDKADKICTYPDWRNESLGSNVEDFDVFICVRAWHTYTQVPLAEPGEPFDPLKNRKPRLTEVVVRCYPARSQSYFAEELQKDGWFDAGGWTIGEWFKNLTNKRIVVGEGQRYDSGAAWNKAFELYRTFGIRNGLYQEPTVLKKLEEEANRLGANSEAARKLETIRVNASITGFDSYFRQTKVERTPEAVAVRKFIFEVKTREDDAERSPVDMYRERVLPQWLDLLLRYPEFRQVETVQDETYALQATYFEKMMRHPYIKTLFVNWGKSAAFAVLPWPNLPEFIKPAAVFEAEMKKRDMKVLPFRDVEGLLDTLFLLDGPGVEAIPPVAQLLARHALWPPPPADKGPDFAFARFVVWAPSNGPDRGSPEIGMGLQCTWPPPKEFFDPANALAIGGAGAGAAVPAPAFLMLSSAEQRRILTQLSRHRRLPAGPGWTPLIPESSLQASKMSIIWLQPRPSAIGK